MFTETKRDTKQNRENMDIARYAREQWQKGSRAEEDVAAAYIELALRSPDVVNMLLGAVKAAVAETFRLERVKVEDKAPWESMGHNSMRTYLGIPAPKPSIDAINELLRTHVWVWRVKANGKMDGMMIPWADLTLEDIGPTIAHERDVIAGHERRIARLEKAREIMHKYQVTRFGDVPFAADRELVTA